jgi:hypothetical protein
LIRRLESITDLSRQEKDALLRLPLNVREMAPDQDIVREGDRPSECCLILSGMARPLPGREHPNSGLPGASI